MIAPVSFAALLGGAELLLILFVLAVLIFVPVLILIVVVAVTRSKTQPQSPVVPLASSSIPGIPTGASSKDAEQVTLLAIFHFILGGLGLLGGGFLLVHFFFVRSMLSHVHSSGTPMPAIGGFFFLFYLLVAFCLAASIAMNVLSGFLMLQKKGRTFSIIVAGLNCLQFPVGTALGVFTILVLLRDSVKALYGEPSVSQPQ